MTTLTALLQHKVKKSSKKPLRWLRKTAFNGQSILSGPYGEHEVFPCAYASCGGSLKIIEKHINEAIDPHLEKDSVLSRRVLADYREDARNYIHKSTNCASDHVVIFTDNEFPDAFSSFLNALDIARLATVSDRAPVICIGHDLFASVQNVVRDFRADPMDIQMTNEGCYDLKQLDAFLKFYKRQGRVLIGVFSVGDEASGALQDTKSITGLLHSYEALSFWDYSSTGAFIKIDMCPLVSYEGLTNKDAAFIQTNRFLGGEGGANVLITNTSILRNSIFETIQEGIMAFSTINGVLDKSISPQSTTHEYSDLYHHLIASPIRTRSVFELKGYFGECFLQKKTAEISELLVTRLSQIPSVYVLDGANPASRTLPTTNPSEKAHHPLPYFSLFFSHPQTEWALHPGFVQALLADLFGIEVCLYSVSLRMLPAVPKLEYQRIMHSLLSNPPPFNFSKSEPVMNVNCVHFSLMHFMKEDDVEFLFNAIKIVAEQGWKMLPFYKFDPCSHKWMSVKPKSHRSEVLVRTISRIRSLQSSNQGVKYRLSSYTERAKKIVSSVDSKSVKKLEDEGNVPQDDEELSDAAKKYRWFMIASDVADLLDGSSPVRLGDKASSPNKKIRSWPCVTTPNSSSMKTTHVSHKLKL
eukprot:g7489.t1